MFSCNIVKTIKDCEARILELESALLREGHKESDKSAGLAARQAASSTPSSSSSGNSDVLAVIALSLSMLAKGAGRWGGKGGKGYGKGGKNGGGKGGKNGVKKTQTKGRKCWNCGEEGHFKMNCPKKPKGSK